MIEFKVEYLKEQNALSISATVGEESGNVAFVYPDDKHDFARSLSVCLNQLINSERSQLVMKEPLSKGILK